MKKFNTDADIYEDEFLNEKKNIKESRSKEKNEARRKIDAYLEKKSLKELLRDYAEDDYDYDWV